MNLTDGAGVPPSFNVLPTGHRNFGNIKRCLDKENLIIIKLCQNHKNSRRALKPAASLLYKTE